MRKIVVFVTSILLSLAALAQRPTATINQVNDFVANSTLYVVLTENPLSDYNSDIRKAVEKNWNVTGWKTVYMSELESKLTNPNNAFLIPVTMQFEEDKDSVEYTFISLLLGGEYETINDLPEVFTFPFSYDGGEDETTYQLPAIINFLNQHVKNIQNNPKLLKDRKYTTYSFEKKSVANKTIYLIKDEQDASLDEEKEIQALFPSAPISFTDAMTLEKVIRRKEANALFFHIIRPADEEMIPGRCYTILLGTDGQLYYFGFHKITDKTPAGLTAKDWKTISVNNK